MTTLKLSIEMENLTIMEIKTIACLLYGICLAVLLLTLQKVTLGNQGPDSIWICRLTGIGNPIVEIRRLLDLLDRLISTIGFVLLVRCHLYIELGPGD